LSSDAQRRVSKPMLSFPKSKAAWTDPHWRAFRRDLAVLRTQTAPAAGNCAP
jgi:hypothetical protein